VKKRRNLKKKVSSSDSVHELFFAGNIKEDREFFFQLSLIFVVSMIVGIIFLQHSSFMIEKSERLNPVQISYGTHGELPGPVSLIETDPTKTVVSQNNRYPHRTPGAMKFNANSFKNSMMSLVKSFKKKRRNEMLIDMKGERGGWSIFSVETRNLEATSDLDLASTGNYIPMPNTIEDTAEKGMDHSALYSNIQPTMGVKIGDYDFIAMNNHAESGQARKDAESVGLSEDEINGVLRSNLGQMQDCYSRAFVQKPGIEGEMVVQLTVGADGKVIGKNIETTKIKLSWKKNSRSSLIFPAKKSS